MGESLLQERKSPSAITLTEPVSEAFEFPAFHWPENVAESNCQGALPAVLTINFCLRKSLLTD